MTAKTPAERKAAERARKREAGLIEVRGIFAPKHQHDAIRQAARDLAQQLQSPKGKE
jgi:hypothetical protein